MAAPPPRLLLALDCDGTLLDPRGEIRPRVRDAVRDAAGHTVASNDADGVAEAVERFVLPRL